MNSVSLLNWFVGLTMALTVAAIFVLLVLIWSRFPGYLRRKELRENEEHERQARERRCGH